MHIRSRRRITYAALAGVLALGGTGLTIGVATAQLGTDDPDLAMVQAAAAKKSAAAAAPTSKAADSAAADAESEEISVADEADDPAESDGSSSETSSDTSSDTSSETGEDDTTTEADDDSTTTESDDDAGTDSDVEQADGTEVTDKTDTGETDTGETDTGDTTETDDTETADDTDTDTDEIEEGTEETATGAEETMSDLTEEQARCPFTTLYKGSVKQMLIKREGVRTKAETVTVKTKKGKTRTSVTIGIGFDMNRGDARTTITGILKETTAPSELDDVKSGKAFDDLKAGASELTEEQVNALFDVSYEEAKELVTRRGIESFDKLPRSVQAALVDLAFARPSKIRDIADEVNLGTQAALAKKQSLSSANYGPAAKRLEAFGDAAAERGQSADKLRFELDAAMLRNKC
ncbi:hypothetical protein FXF51_02980 [Nonomuraea sp. PA05]|uniref:hypothetical protein n=1 Tax=Nonomuraea sp. PA05 TaxID=2604466 RepID=UPI0011D9C1F8|nr:hypothetical protein [Nonomuraea sp. PA05]TYB71403.1 hypothetical protein FXF51_02980 [Nonomuraea sp. PA05]